MAGAERSRKAKPKEDEQQAQVEDKKTEAASTEDVDELLEEIDSVLETNAEEFVRSFVQKGGQVVIFFALGGTALLSHWQ